MEDPFQNCRPVKLHHISISPTDARYEVPIVLVHGSFVTLNTWKQIMEKLSTITGRKVYAIDIRNHGKSENTEEFSLRHLAADLVQFLTEENIERAILAGHSLGGRTVMEVALHKPKLVEKLIVEEAAISDGKEEHKTAFDNIISLFYRIVSSLPRTMTEREAYQKLMPLMKQHLPQLTLNGGFSATNSVLPFYKDKMTGEFKFHCNMEVMNKLMHNLDSLKNDLMGDPVYPGKCLFLKGEHTVIPMDEDRELIQKHFPNVQFVTVKRGYHVIHIENMEDFLKAVTDFLES